MLLFRRGKKRAVDSAFLPKLPPGDRVYAIGDIHGRADLLEALIRLIRADIQIASPANRPIVVTLGDYIDRGGESGRVLDILCRAEFAPDFHLVPLRGNHDQFLLDFLEQPVLGRSWINYGGGATLAAYGVPVPRTQTDENAWIAAGEQLAEIIPSEHLEFIRRAAFVYTLGDYVFVHAGVRPGVPLDQQKTSDLISIRDVFLSSRNPLPGHVVVFGHTPFETPLVDQARIGVDTGACATGVLTAVVLEGEERSFLRTGRGDDLDSAYADKSEFSHSPRRL